MQTITTIGLDIAKSVFQVHGVDNDGKVVIRRQSATQWRSTSSCCARRVTTKALVSSCEVTTPNARSIVLMTTASCSPESAEAASGW